MQFLITIWQRLPIILCAVIAGLIVVTAGVLPWSILVAANLRYPLKFFPSLPWAVPAMALYLWLFWQYLKGKGWPPSTAETRRMNLRANALSPRAWRWSLGAGSLAAASLIALRQFAERLVDLPAPLFPEVSQYPFVPVLLIFLMSSAVAGIVEEAGYRGYMQAPIERRHGPIIAIIVVGTVFAVGHFSHAWMSWRLLPYYLAGSTIFGVLAYLTGSILPGIVLHTIVDALRYIQLLWSSTATPQPLIGETGADLKFWTNVLAFIGLGATAIWAYYKLAAVVRSEPRLVN
ncbi:CPBP family intramembrane metalloprotease [candidate division KSB1 bacterium]|nr:CPBP family intramembrane metalloprotease [candidate division KSB1 bacterium]